MNILSQFKKNAGLVWRTATLIEKACLTGSAALTCIVSVDDLALVMLREGWIAVSYATCGALGWTFITGIQVPPILERAQKAQKNKQIVAAFE